MRTIRGPAVFLAQFIVPEPPYDRLDTLARWAAEKGFVGVQVPIFNPAIFDVAKAAESDAYCDEVKGSLADHGLVLTELSSHRSIPPRAASAMSWATSARTRISCSPM